MCTPSTYKCQICSVIIPAKHKSDHLTVHFKDKISPLLARSAPFSCPKCRYVAIERSSLIRHFATKHGLVDAFLKVNTYQLYKWPIIAIGNKQQRLIKNVSNTKMYKVRRHRLKCRFRMCNKDSWIELKS